MADTCISYSDTCDTLLGAISSQESITWNLQGVDVFSLAGCQWDAARTSVHKFENADTLRVLVLDGYNIQELHLDGASDLRLLQV